MTHPPPPPPRPPPTPPPGPQPSSATGKRSGLLKWALRLALVLLVLLAAGILFRNSLIRAGTEAVVTRVTGFPLTLDSFDLGLLDGRIEMKGMHLRNPGGFEDPRCIEVPRLVAQVDLESVRSEVLHLPEIVLDVKEVVVVRNAAGEINLDRLRALGGSGDGGKGGAKEPADSGPGRRWRIDRLELTMGRVLLLDYTKLKDGKPREETWDVGVDHEEFRNVDSPEAIVKIIVLKVLRGTSIRLVNASVERLTEGLKGPLADSLKGLLKR